MSSVLYPDFPPIESHEVEPADHIVVPALNLEITGDIRDGFEDRFISLLDQLSDQNVRVNRIDHKANRKRSKSALYTQNQEARKHHYQTGSDQTKEDLISLIYEGDTPVLLTLLSQTARGSVVNQSSDEAVVRDTHNDAQRAKNQSRSARIRLADARRQHAGNPIFENPSAPGWAAAGGEESRHKARKVEDMELSVKSAKKTLAERKAMQRVDRAVSAYKLQEGLPELFNSLLNDITIQRARQMETLVATEGSVGNELDYWAFGEPSSGVGQQERIVEGLTDWQEQLGGLSLYDSERADSLAQWITESTRLHQRQALLLDTDDPSLPRFSPDRGVIVNTPDGEQILYEDGSVTRNEGPFGDPEEDGRPVRRQASGEIWALSGNTIPEPDYYEHLDELSDDSLELEFMDAVRDWEQIRSTETDADAGYASRAYADRLAQRTNEQQGHYENQLSTTDEIGQTLDAAVAGREAEIARLISERGDSVVPEDIAEIERIVDSRISDLNHQRTEAESYLRDQLTALQEARERLNRAEYFRSFFAVTQPVAAQGHSEGQAQTQARGTIEHTNKTLNGITGNWVINLDGSATLYLEDGSGNHYAPNGELVSHEAVVDPVELFNHDDEDGEPTAPIPVVTPIAPITTAATTPLERITYEADVSPALIAGTGLMAAVKERMASRTSKKINKANHRLEVLQDIQGVFDQPQEELEQSELTVEPKGVRERLAVRLARRDIKNLRASKNPVEYEDRQRKSTENIRRRTSRVSSQVAHKRRILTRNNRQAHELRGRQTRLRGETRTTDVTGWM